MSVGFRANGQHVIFDYQDFSGFGPTAPTDGRESFLDAGTIASQGNQTYDLSGFVNPAHPLPPGCNIKIKGIAPGASLAVLNVAGSNAGFFNSQIIQAIEHAVLVDHVNILNESFGGNPLPNTTDDPVSLADQAAVAVGVTVVVSSGTVNLAAVADTNPFDSAVSASSGDVWAESVNASAPYSPLTLGPGQSGTITLTITPNAPKGTVVHGFIAVDTFNLATLSGDELTAIPYTYTVG